jgi:hypothetical protein
MDSSQDSAVLPAEGFPIRTSTDRSLVGGSPWLFAATHVLHRLSEPRHPPHALSSLVTLNSGLPSRWLERQSVQGRDPNPSEIRSSRRPRCYDALLPFVFGCQSASPAEDCTAVRDTSSRMKTGGADRNRTDDIQLAKLALYQLSYSPTKPWSEMVGLGGFEPPTSRLSGVRSKPTEL